MKRLGNKPQPHRLPLRLAYAAALCIGAFYGFGFGMQVSGPWLGIVTAVNGAVFCALLVGAASDGISRLRRRDRAESSGS
jgi:peptidoglycan/LPS O-acetylase OafA/YrhL